MTHTSNLARRRIEAQRDASPQYEQTRVRLVSAAADVFRSKGFSNATLQEIADSAGMNRASIYYYAESKEELFRGIALEAIRENAAEIQRISQCDESAADKVRLAIRGLLFSYERTYPHLYVYIQEEMERVLSSHTTTVEDPQVQAVMTELFEHSRDYLRHLEDIVRSGIEDGTFSPGDPRLLALGIQGMVNWTHRWYRPHGRFSIEHIADTFSDLALTGLLKRTHSL